MANTNKTLHELSSKNFSRTPNGLIFTNDLKTVYSIFLICLDLKEKKHNSDTKSFLLTPFIKHFEFTFTYQEAIKAMGQLELKVDMNTTCINAVSYTHLDVYKRQAFVVSITLCKSFLLDIISMFSLLRNRFSKFIGTFKSPSFKSRSN